MIGALTVCIEGLDALLGRVGLHGQALGDGQELRQG